MMTDENKKTTSATMLIAKSADLMEISQLLTQISCFLCSKSVLLLDSQEQKDHKMISTTNFDVSNKPAMLLLPSLVQSENTRIKNTLH